MWRRDIYGYWWVLVVSQQTQSRIDYIISVVTQRNKNYCLWLGCDACAIYYIIFNNYSWCWCENASGWMLNTDCVYERARQGPSGRVV